MMIKVLGTGCSKCHALEKVTFDALADLGVTADVQKVTKMDEIMKHDVMITPALVINDRVKAAGKVPKIDEVKAMIQEEL